MVFNVVLNLVLTLVWIKDRYLALPLVLDWEGQLYGLRVFGLSGDNFELELMFDAVMMNMD